MFLSSSRRAPSRRWARRTDASNPGPTPALAPAPDADGLGDRRCAAETTGAGAATTERVVVTGSYIPTAETESALPVTVYTATVLKKQGANTPAEGLRQLPSFVGNAVTENDSTAVTVLPRSTCALSVPETR